MDIRIGTGIDVHPFVEGRELFLGGVKIPYHKGLLGHSDADVLLHAIADALLGGVALADIGHHFPDTDPAYQNIPSRTILEQSYDLVRQEGYELINLDTVLMLEEPKISPFIPEIRKTIADMLWCRLPQISVKATTFEKLGFIGSKEGVVAQAIVLLKRRKG